MYCVIACNRFESFVNSEEYQTIDITDTNDRLFESFVNSEEYQTLIPVNKLNPMFESFVNSEEYQTLLIKQSGTQ